MKKISWIYAAISVFIVIALLKIIGDMPDLQKQTLAQKNDMRQMFVLLIVCLIAGGAVYLVEYVKNRPAK